MLEHTDHASNLGSKIRALRSKLGRTLEEIAVASGLSKAFLSQVERGLANPSIMSVKHIAGALGVEVSLLFQTPSEEISIRRREQLEFANFLDSENSFAQLTRLSGRRRLESVLVRLPSGQAPLEIAGFAGQDFLLVIAGGVVLKLGSDAFILGEGDSIHYESPVPHSWVNAGRKDSIVIRVRATREKA
ncbi:transcriptional regulator, XRE family with cupin sensor [Paraburkholderia steynii]|uniref:Transcriptional regulator, XRE family with cupin sensor n=1 Tax=Paraburkholderia steynii TaxID=1245441 RepID=A0A7Z7FRF8_9BURK|nr:XRE family transcriptional regulator [Paraburkholderia steynii]SDJ53801.1 transcriptional regulator, XRE family with cupin sensor [Paraburkholderia steynii]